MQPTVLQLAEAIRDLAAVLIAAWSTADMFSSSLWAQAQGSCH